ncbi:hypothetical protein [Dendronalium sp. ChiSLP03b]|uniref:hypothetical protein n=1 Tax=Dendronalium sp. ChiSLP03b TaxID=3075381 RepID=UPI003918B2AE
MPIPPINPIQVGYWDEPGTNEGIVNLWNYNGSIWLSRKIYQTNILLAYGQTIVIGGTVGQISADTTDVPVPVGTATNLYLKRLTLSFTTTGNLSASNYWKLQFKSAASVTHSLNVTSGNNNEITGHVSKTSADINTLYLNTGRYSLNLVKVGSAPNINNPVCLLEYYLNKSLT